MQLIRLKLALVIPAAIPLLLGACANAASQVSPPSEATGELSPLATLALKDSEVPPSDNPAPDKTQAAEAETQLTPPFALLTCRLTPTDMLGPFYTPGAPVRNQVGTGYVLTGVVRSGSDCSPVPGAQLDFWMAGPNGEYGDEWRAVTFSAADGSYRFESHSPPGYSGRPPHIHILVSAAGFATLVTQHYPVQGATQAVFDLVLSPAEY